MFGMNLKSFQDGLTALALACKEGNYEIVSQLLSSGAYVNLQAWLLTNRCSFVIKLSF